MKVLLVATGSPAAKAGWKNNEEISAVNGEKIGSDFGKSKEAHWSSEPAGTVVTLTMPDGTARKLTLADYY